MATAADEACFVDWPFDKDPARVDFLGRLPVELGLFVLLMLGDDPLSVLAARVVSRRWRTLAEDPVVWRHLFRLRTPPWSLSPQLPPSSRSTYPTASASKSLFQPQSLALLPSSFPSSPLPHLSRQDSLESYQTNGSGNFRVARRLSQLLGEPSLGDGLSRFPPLSRPSSSSSSTPFPSHNPPPCGRRLQHNVPDPLQVIGSPLGTCSSVSSQLDTSFGRNPECEPISDSLDWFQLYRDRSIIDHRWGEGKLKPRALCGHKDSIYCVEFDGDQRLMTGSRDRTIKIWDIPSGKCLNSLAGHHGSVLCLRADHPMLISGSSDCKIIKWIYDLHSETYQVQAELIGHQSGVLDLCSNSKVIISCSKDTTIKVWDQDTNQLIRTISGHQGPVNALQLLRNQYPSISATTLGSTTRFLSAAGDSTMKLWELESGQCVRSFEGHLRGLACMKLVEELDLVISGSKDEMIKVWEISTGRCLKNLVGHVDLVRSLDFDLLNRRLISGSYDKTIKVWDLDLGKLMLDFRKSSCQKWNRRLRRLEEEPTESEREGDDGTEASMVNESNRSLSNGITPKFRSSLTFDLKVNCHCIVSVGQDCHIMIVSLSFPSH